MNSVDLIFCDIEQQVIKNKSNTDWLKLYQILIELKGLNEYNRSKQIELVAELGYRIRK